jgi:hypothetical protein
MLTSLFRASFGVTDCERKNSVIFILSRDIDDSLSDPVGTRTVANLIRQLFPLLV